MINQVLAKLKVNRLQEIFSGPGQASQREVVLNAVYSSDPTSPNYSFSKYTPSAELKMVITNPDAFQFFEGGTDYLVTFTKVGD